MSSPTSPAAVPTLRRPRSVALAASLDRPGPALRWTPLGTVDAAAIGDVDPAGAVQPRGARWSLDWWVGAEDRWHHPSVEAAVRQQELEHTPVIETAMRVPGGDVVHRVAGVRATSDGAHGLWDDSALLVEIENLTSVPVALALVVSGLGLDGVGHLGSVRVDGPVVRLDGRVGAVLSRPPARLAVGTLGEVAGRLAAGEDRSPGEPVPSDPEGRLEVALVVPLPHTSVVSVLVPRVAEAPRRRFGRSAASPEPGPSFEAPAPSAVVAGWQAHTRDVARVELPEQRLADALTGSQRTLVLAAGDGFLGDELPGADAGADAATRAAAICELLVRSGLREPLEPLARALVASQRLNGEVRLADGSDASLALVDVASGLLRPGAELWIEDLLGPVAKALHRLSTHPPAEVAPAAVATVGRIVAPLRSIDQPDVADGAAELAVALAERTPPSRGAMGSSGEAALGDDPASGRSAALAAPLVERALALRAGSDVGSDDDLVASLVELARVGTPGTLVDRVDAAGVPVGGLGSDPAAVAARGLAVLDLALVETPVGLELFPTWPDAWWGRAAEAHGIRTRWGRVSFALRWHGERPALLWEIEQDLGEDGTPAPELRAPALDPAWRATAATGEALLGPVPAPAAIAIARGATTGGDPGGALLGDVVPDAAVELPAPPGEGQSFS